MAKIQINNPRQIINGGAKKYYFKVKGLGGPKGDKGDKGDTGATGPQGPQGNAATVYVGSTTTLPVGQDATVENVGTQYNAVLNFGIPQGPQGPQGIQGERGEPGQTGQTGPRGPQGERGTNATVYIGTTTTLNPGSQATVYNSGTENNAVLNFGIPKGEKGDTGPMPTIAQTTGQAIDQVMSQKATTDALNTKQATITNSNKLSADLVTDTTTTNKFVTAEDKTTWNAKQNALTAGHGIDITSDVISTPALVPEVVAELPTTGEDGVLYLVPKAHTTQTASGNQINVNITDGAGKIESLKLDGDTYQQSYTGKNLININSIPGEVYHVTYEVSGQKLIINDSDQAGNYHYVQFRFTDLTPGETYTISAQNITASQGTPTGRILFATYGTGITPDTNIGGVVYPNTSYTFTVPSNATSIGISLYARGGSGVSYIYDRIMLEKSSTATSFEPYVGGVPSPNPDYPQQIQTVTGTQTVSINGTDYPISLGSIELCKLDTYQDYIYKDGDSWKVHKATANITLNTSGWSKSNATANNLYINQYIPNLINNSPLLATNLTVYSSVYIYNNDIVGICYNTTGQGLASIRIGVGLSGASTVTAFKSWLESNPVTLYYALATPTDTTITDQTLIAQLEAVRTAALSTGSNTISNTATGTNLAGDLELGYYEFDPHNRYDKWLWLDINNNYEQLGS